MHDATNRVQKAASHVVAFDCYEANFESQELRKRGIRLGLREQSFKVLAALLERPGEIVSREQLYELLWRGSVFVDFDNNLNTVVAHLREVLCDSAEHPRFIETLPKRGYRFIADVHRGVGSPTEPRLGRSRLLVLPFVNLSGDPAQEYFSDAMTDEVITTLAGAAPAQLAVIARTTSMRYKATRKDVARIGRELNVDYIVAVPATRLPSAGPKPGWPKIRLAKRDFEAGVHRTSMGSAERLEQKISLENIVRIARALKVTPSQSKAGRRAWLENPTRNHKGTSGHAQASSSSACPALHE